MKISFILAKSIKGREAFFKVMNKRGMVFNPVDLIAGVILVVAGVATVTGNVNLGSVLAGIGLLVEAIKILLKQGF